MMQKQTISEGSWVIHQPAFLDHDQQRSLQEHLIETLPWEQPDIMMFGKAVKIPRLQAWIGDPDAHYRWSGKTFVPSPWTPVLKALTANLNQQLNTHFNSVLINWYRSGEDSMGWHSDDEKELGPDPTIASLSLGAPRNFKLRERHKTPPQNLSYALGNGDLFVMGGATQSHWRHCVVKTRKSVQARLNLTFRDINPERHETTTPRAN